MRFRPLLAAVAAAGLLAAGCDYWRNLVDDRTVATARLQVKVRDAFTGEHLAATCTDSNRGLVLQTSSGDGQADTRGAGTGMYSILCRAPRDYYEKRIAFSLTPAGGTVVFGLARLGTEGAWYKDDTLREVRIREKPVTLRFPGDFDFNAYPKDTIKPARFRYKWTFAKAKGLGQDSNSTNSGLPYLRKRVETVNAEPGPDTLTLQVWSHLNGEDAPYYIGEAKRPFVWARNQLPTLDMQVDTLRQYSSGCPLTDQPVRIRFRGADPDGECRSVRFYTEDTASSFGAVDTTLTCFEQSTEFNKINFDLKDRFDYLGGDTTILRNNRLKISVTDDNGGSYNTSIGITTRSNRPPSVSWGILGSRVAFTNDSVKVWFEALDVDGAPREAIVNWIDEGESRMEYKPKSGQDSMVLDTTFWIFRTPGVKRFKFFVTDICNGWVNSAFDSVIVRENRLPEVGFKYLRNEGTAQNHLYVFEISIEDKDISEGLNDRITEVHVDWGEGSRPLEPTDAGSTYRPKHHFNQPPDSLGRYPIIINVHDAHGGLGTLETFFRVP